MVLRNALASLSAPVSRSFAATVRPTATGTQATSLTSAKRYSSMHDNDPAILEREKQRNLKKEQNSPHEHAPGWNESLASASEAHVKADKSTGTPKDLQSSTIDAIQKKHHSDDRASAGQSSAKDEVGGPLGDARGSTHASSGIHHAPDGSRTVIKKHVHDETTTEVRLDRPTDSDEAVKADRGEV